jgi:hypothetical protein
MHGKHRGLQADGSAGGQRGVVEAQALIANDRDGLLTAISDGLAGLVEEFYGLRPTETKSYYQDDLVVCVMRCGFDRFEQSPLDAGRWTTVIEQRKAFRELMLDRVIAVVEDATSQRVTGFMSGDQQSPEMICEVFILAPAERSVSGGPSSRRAAPLTEVSGGDRADRFGHRRDHGAF